MAVVTVVPMLVDAGNTATGSATQSTFGRSYRFVELADMYYCRFCVGAQVTTTGIGGTIRYGLRYSLDSTNGSDGTFDDIIDWCDPIGETYTMLVTPWTVLPQDALNPFGVWIKVEYQMGVPATATTSAFMEVHFR